MMKGKKEKPYHHGNLRAALVEAATGLIEERGPDGFTLREVARRARVSQAAPYRHFRDRDDLLAAVVEQGFLGLSEVMSEVAASTHAPAERFRRCGAAYVTYALERTAHFQVMFRMEPDPEKHPAARAAADAAFGQLVGVVAACQESGVLPGRNARVVALIAWSLVHGIAHLAIGKQFQFKTRAEVLRFAGVATDALLEGLRVGNRAAK
jgi:AcrR family transcriptional regulator